MVTTDHTIKRVVILGYYGYRNSGDEAVLHAILTALREEGQTKGLVIAPTVISGDVSYTQTLHHVQAIHRFDVRAIHRAWRESDAFICGGGSLLQDVTSARSMLYYLGMIQWALRARLPVYIYSQGMGPVRRKWLFARWIGALMKRCRYVSVRDPASHTLLTTECGVDAKQVDVVVDPVLGCTVQTPMVRERRIAISLRDWQGGERVFEVVCEALWHVLQETDVDIVFLPFHEPDDRHVSDRICEALWQRGVMRTRLFTAPPLAHPQDMIDTIASCTVLLGMRLHALIYATVARTPCIGISYDPKIDQFLHMIQQQPIGSTTTVEATPLRQCIVQCLGQPVCPEDERLAHTARLYELARTPAHRILALMQRQTVELFGVSVSQKTLDATVDDLAQAIANNAVTHVVTANPTMVMHALQHRSYYRMLRQADLVVPDGIGLVWAARHLRKRVASRVAGYDLVQQLFLRGATHGWRIYLLGATAEVIAQAHRTMQQTYAEISIVGSEHGYFSADEDQAVIARIRQAKPHILLVGRSMANQDVWIAKYRQQLQVPVMVGVGGSFDVMAGRLRRAPQWVQRMKLEWLYRLYQEPSRLPRMLVLPRFVLRVLFFGDRMPPIRNDKE
jgi:N-acetylglucosaminyldiphosphoundecaprenol N-acetyl-beta-D-mannosaminyltransferase